MNRQELIGKMICASADALGLKVYDHQMVTKGMDTALTAAVEELLGSADPNETWAWHEKFEIPELAVVNVIAAYRASRRAKLERVKTPEERIEIVDSTNGGYAVLVDGKQVFWQSMRHHAEIYRLGLIAKLKDSQ